MRLKYRKTTRFFQYYRTADSGREQSDTQRSKGSHRLFFRRTKLSSGGLSRTFRKQLRCTKFRKNFHAKIPMDLCRKIPLRFPTGLMKASPQKLLSETKIFRGHSATSRLEMRMPSTKLILNLQSFFTQNLSSGTTHTSFRVRSFLRHIQTFRKYGLQPAEQKKRMFQKELPQTQSCLN